MTDRCLRGSAGASPARNYEGPFRSRFAWCGTSTKTIRFRRPVPMMFRKPGERSFHDERGDSR